MFKHLLYKIVRGYIKLGLHLFYKKITVQGLENIPKKATVLFVANHQNAMMDPLVIAVNNPRILYFLARASAFKNKIAGKLLNKINAIAIYRVRDGVDSKKLNEGVFKHCNKLLNNNKSILIFPEGSHNIVRKLRSLRAGFVRIAFDYLEKNMDKEFYIIPVGLNYNNTINYAKEVKIIYGKPILVSQFYDKDQINKSRANLIDTVHAKIKELIVHIEDDDNYDRILNNISEAEFLTPKITNPKITNGKFKKENPSVKKENPKNIFYYLLLLNSIIPFLLWKWLKPKIQAIEFVSTAKFSLGLTIFPLTYLFQAALIDRFFGGILTLIYLFFSIVLVYVTTKTR